MLRTLKLLFLPLFCLLTGLLLAQTTGYQYIAKSGAEAEMKLMSEGPDYKIANEVFQKLVEARGDFRFEVPAFYVSTGSSKVAFISADSKSIAIEEQALELCKKQGENFENALAALLGHELIHFYEKHLWRDEFTTDFQGLDISTTLSSLQDRVLNETQADYLGGFLAYSAGYKVFEGLPHLLDEVYKTYKLKNEVRGYPSLQDRQTLATRSVEKLKGLVEIFEMANVMTAIGRYDEARALYRQILGDYQGREIYNNLGIVTLLEAKSYFEEKDMPFQLPVELEVGFAASGRGFGDNIEETRKRLLNEAITYFNYAIGLDAGYAPAYLNKACAYFLLDDIPRARFYAETEAVARAKDQPNRFANTPTDVEILSALLLNAEGNKSEAIADLKKIMDKDDENSIAAHNLMKLDPSFSHSSAKKGRAPNTRIDGIKDGLNTFWINWELDYDFEKELNGGIRLARWSGHSEVSEVKEALTYSTFFALYPSDRASDTDPVFMQITNPDYTGIFRKNMRKPSDNTRIDIKVGSPSSDLVDVFRGAPDKVIGLPNGEMMIYKSLILFVQRDTKDGPLTLRRWAVVSK
ncbi:MAG: hypothetical protein KTR30_37490 [Saprospiraceae bacterium]|nr:hypothetical protein [Saprospiraceae bacterium]